MPLFNHFEAFFEQHVLRRKSLQLRLEQDSPPEADFPVADCLAVLRVSAILLENTTNKHLYQSYDVSARASPHAPGGATVQLHAPGAAA